MKKQSELLSQLENAVMLGDAKITSYERSKISKSLLENGDATSEELDAWVHYVAFSSYKTLDRHITELKQEGYSEQAIFEATCVAAFTVSNQLLRKGLKLLTCD